MIRTLSLLSAVSSLLLLGVADAVAQQAQPGSTRQTAPARKATAGQPVSATAKRSSATTKASGANTTTRAASSSQDTNRNNPDSPNTVNANGSIGSQESADGKGQGVYAAPGMPVTPRDNKVDPYDGKAAKPAAGAKKGSTLKPKPSSDY